MGVGEPGKDRQWQREVHRLQEQGNYLHHILSGKGIACYFSLSEYQFIGPSKHTCEVQLKESFTSEKPKTQKDRCLVQFFILILIFNHGKKTHKIYHLSHLSVYSSVVLNIFPVLCNPPPELFHFAKLNRGPH